MLQNLHSKGHTTFIYHCLLGCAIV
uniref:Uncharacterized protein n=1 Tax=Arundo donax TaxID=35708 RepID=A0A0A9HCL2_ARUDO